MDSTEEIQKCIAVAQSLSLEARTLPELKGLGEDSALQHMGALLASNCQKLCIGPSYHFYTAESSQDGIKESKELEEALIGESADEDEYETVIYKGPDMPFEIVEDTHTKKTVQPNSQPEEMKLRLAQASAEYGGLLSPNFFLQSPGNASRAHDASSAQNSHFSTTPFSFPIVNDSPGVKTKDTTIHGLERVELLEDACSDNESEWVEWPKKFIENKGFCLGIQPGNFYKEESRSRFYVKLPHRCNYEILVTNNNQLPCDMDLYVDGQLSNALRIPAGASRSIDGPQYSKHAFKLFRVEEPPPGKEVKEGDLKNGFVKAVFIPCKIGTDRLRSASDPLGRGIQNDILDLLGEDPQVVKKRAFTAVNSGDQGNIERSLDMSQVTEGVTLLQGRKKKREYVIAPEMETDPSKKVILQLRLIASLDEEIAATEEEICDLEPPPLPKKK